MSVAAIQAATITPCTTGTLSGYVGFGSNGCSVGDLVVSGFQILPTASTAISPSGVTVTPGMGGLQFGYGRTANIGQVFESNFGFNVSSLTGMAITGETFGLGGSSAMLDGGVAGISSVCAGAISSTGSCPTSPAGRNLATFALDGFTQTSDQISFIGTPVLGVMIDASADGGSLGMAVLGNTSVRFTEAASVPEPATMGMFVVALGGLVLAGARKRFAKRF
ncbi:MAG: PEP-CTERM sorting domain-containing protein [Acidobacteriota bacterium]|nr:PEP-CTERM sorting domain-containing protein [Acidobacteriota bacterium]